MLPPTGAAAIISVLLALTWSGLVAVGDDEQSAPSGSPPTAPTTRLPWEVARKRPQSAKEFLEFLGVDASQWNNLSHEQPLGAADEEMIDRLLHHLPRIGGESTFRWRQTEWDFAEIGKSPAKYQGQILWLRGCATKCERVPLIPELVDRYEFDHYYRVHLQLEDKHTAIICTRHVPLAWTKQEELSEPAETDGIFIKTSPVADSPPQLVCASLRVAWLPENANEANGITPSAVMLAQHGFDIGLWDLLRGRQKRGLDDADREPFYRLLGAVQKLPVAEAAIRNAPPVNIAVAVKSPERQTGHFVTVDGTVNRIDRVEVNSGDLQIWSGLDHYYTLYVFVPLLNERIGLQRNPNDKNPRIFDRHFPVTVCVPELPAGLKPSSDVHEHVRLHGVFFKVWTYKPQGGGAEGSPDGNDLPQPSPLIIAASAEIVRNELPSDPNRNILGGVLFVALIAVLGIVIWRMNVSDARFKRDVLEQKILKEDKVDLSQLEE
jgi:hypothetical protein